MVATYLPAIVIISLCAVVSSITADTTADTTARQYDAFQTKEELYFAVDLYLETNNNQASSISTISTKGTRSIHKQKGNGNTNNNDIITEGTLDINANTNGDGDEIDAITLTDLEERYGPIEGWDVSSIDNFSKLFSVKRNPLSSTFDVDLSRWDVSNATFIQDMFLGAALVDFDVGGWDVSKVRKFNGMFELAESFRGVGLDKWDVGNGHWFMTMFAGTQSLLPTLDLSGWNMQHAEDLTSMFRDSNFGSGPAFVPSADGLGGLCPWMYRLGRGVDVAGMFAGSQCPNTSDPNLDSRASISFCVPCDIVRDGDIEDTHEKRDDDPSVNGGRRPNVLMIMADQMRFDMIESIQNELEWFKDHLKIRTPNLDRLKDSGVYFKNTYCQTAVCGPARTSLRTGCTIERTGVQTNNLVMEKFLQDGTIFQKRVQNLESIDHILVDKLGYVSEYYGKWHMPDALMFTRNTTSSGPAPNVLQNNDYDYERDQFYFLNDLEAPKLRRYLQYFDDLGHINKNFTEEGMQIDSFTHYPYTPIRLDPRWHMPSGTDVKNGSFHPSERSEPNVMGRFKLDERYTPSFFTGDLSIKALKRLQRQQRRDNKPWFLTASFHSPHAPFVATWKYLRYYWENRSEIFVPPSINDRYENSPYPDGMKWLPGYREVDKVQEWMALYYALIHEVDVYVGRLIEALGDDAANTLVIFTSDHGEMLAAHGSRGKSTFYEDASRVPLFLSFPGVIESGRVVEELVSHLDVVSTILDYIDATDLDRTDGESLRPLVESREEFSRDYDQDVVVAEWDYRMPLPDNATVLDRAIDERPSFMVRKGQWKLMMQKLATSTKWDVLIDLENDPFEVENLLGRHAMSPTAVSDVAIAKAEHLRCLLLDWMDRMDGDERYYSDPAANYGEGRGDIVEVRDRQQWRQVGLWVSDESTGLQFGTFSPTGRKVVVRHEWLYFGTRTTGQILTVKSLSISGSDAPFFSVDDTVVGTTVAYGECGSIRVTFDAAAATSDGPSWEKSRTVNATLNLEITTSDEVSSSSSSRRITIPLLLTKS